MTQFRIPIDGDEQDREINEKYGIHRVTGWELAGRIYARCESGTNSARDDINPANLAGTMSSGRVSFAKLSRTTGRSETNIRKHWHNWHDAIVEGKAVAVKPGDLVDPPADDYPLTANDPGLRGKFTKNTPPEEKAAAIQEIMQREPEVARRVENAFVQKAAKDPALASKVRRAYDEHHVTPEPKVATGTLDTTAVLGVSAQVIVDIRRYRPEVMALVEHFTHGGEMSDATRAALVYEVETFERCKVLLDEYADAVRGVLGGSVDETFARLTSDWGA